MLGLLDGESITDILFQNSSTEARTDKVIYHYCGDILMAIRVGRYKVIYSPIPVLLFLLKDCTVYDVITMCGKTSLFKKYIKTWKNI